MKKLFFVTISILSVMSFLWLGTYSVTYAKTVNPLHLSKQTYSSSKTRVFHMETGNSWGYPINLGKGITGYGDAGAGTQGITWNEGRWTIEVLSPIDPDVQGSNLGLPTAKRIVAYLHTHCLPIPHKYGFLQLYTDGRFEMVSFQTYRIVYSTETIISPMNVVKDLVKYR